MSYVEIYDILLNYFFYFFYFFESWDLLIHCQMFAYFTTYVYKLAYYYK